ncbi:phosphate acetyltransferase [Verrucomicrobiaceae bacterium N1E253]|uniref:Phosphate acetyltransferase n=1 Tax=Oceaniferula marina TaxID=2748318 RepID=A0A851GRC9_9BACT|nr:phosphate acetyltransferase [Oceaniferula marina]NWK56764.1 phosphate acetyltransferase [Oceaniferula marina]
MHTILVVPLSDHAGLTSTSIGLVRALDRMGIHVSFFKPISQSYHEQSEDLSTAYIKTTTSLTPPEPISMEETEMMLASGASETLLEQITEKYQQAAENADIVIVEGLQASSKNQFLNSLNPRIAHALNAEVIFVASAKGKCLEKAKKRICRRLDSACEAIDRNHNDRVLGAIINQNNKDQSEESKPNIDLTNETLPLKNGELKLLGLIPYDARLTQLRTSDLIEPLNAKILNEGEINTRRVTSTHLCARNIDHVTHTFHAGSLIVTPADRSDIILSTCYAALTGIPIAGLILTGDTHPSEAVLEFCQAGIDSGLPVMTTATSSLETANVLSSLNPEIPTDDTARLEHLVNHVARHLDTQWLQKYSETPNKPRLSPPAFRHQISQIARSNPKRIVLPEGEEPRTIEAAVICHKRGVAKPVLLGNHANILNSAATLGIDFPTDIEILDPQDYRDRYIDSFMELRKHKNLSKEQAVSRLENNITLGTMMLAEGHVDGLVSGAIHSTADTIRPALQLIRTAPGVSSVSSVFFMCLPDQVLVYGDCAINLDPDASQLADIAIQSSSTAKAFGIDPRVAMISYSTHDSGSGSDVDKVRTATARVKELQPNIMVDGPLQYDAASNASIAKTKAPNSAVAGDATVYIFPDLNTGNTTYKAVQRAGNVISMGPVLQGLNKPVNDLSRGASVEDIVFTIAITSIQAQ